MTPLETWAAFWLDLTPSTIPHARRLCTSDFHFVDPFNDLIGVPAFENLLQHMFSALEEPRFVVDDVASGRHAGYLRWCFTARLRQRPLVIQGMSEVGITPAGLISRHVDHWDAAQQVYAHVPILGTGIRWVRRRLSVVAS